MKARDTRIGGVFALLLALFFVVACSQFDNVPSAGALPGVYEVNGVDKNGKEYARDLTIALSGKAFDIKWSEDARNFRGTGVYMGSHLGSVFAEAGSDAKCGAIFYRLFGADNLSGTAAVLGEENPGSESGTRQRGKHFEGEYGIFGTNPKGEQYSGTLNIKKNGDAYDVSWQIGEEEGNGVGHSSANVLAVVFGDDVCQIALYRNDRGFFEDSSVVRFAGKIGDANGFSGTELIDKRVTGRAGTANN